MIMITVADVISIAYIILALVAIVPAQETKCDVVLRKCVLSPGCVRVAGGMDVLLAKLAYRLLVGLRHLPAIVAVWCVEIMKSAIP
jgi:hypothetical protein